MKTVNITEEQLANELVGTCCFCGQNVELRWIPSGIFRVMKPHRNPKTKNYHCPGSNSRYHDASKDGDA